MPETEEIAAPGGPRRWLDFGGSIILAGSIDLLRAVSGIAAFGIGSSAFAILAGGVILAAHFNVAWIFAAVILLLLLIAVVGGYRVWSRTELELQGKRSELQDALDRAEAVESVPPTGPTGIAFTGGAQWSFINSTITQSGPVGTGQSGQTPPTGPFHRQSIRLHELVEGPLPVIQGHTFDDCDLHGPMVLFHDGTSTLQVDTAAPTEAVFIVAEERGADTGHVGVVLLHNCVLRSCRLHQVAFIGTPGQIWLMTGGQLGADPNRPVGAQATGEPAEDGEVSVELDPPEATDPERK